MEIDADTGSSVCSETTSVSHLPIDVSMEMSAPVIISVHTTEGGVSTTTTCTTGHTWERMVSTTGSLPDDTMITTTIVPQARDSNESLSATDRRQERGSSVGREVQSVASRLFRRRDKSAVRGEENRDMKPQTSSDESASRSDESARWFRKKGEKMDKKEIGSSKITESSNKKPKKEKLKRDSESEGSGSSDQRQSTTKTSSSESGKSRCRPLMFQEKIIEAPSAVSIVDIKKEHLHLPEVSSERRLSTPGMDSTVISASLTIKVPLSRSQTGPAIAFGQGRDTDIPFIEDIPQEPPDSQLAAANRQRYLDKRHKSSPFFQKSTTEKEQKSSKSVSASSTAATAPVIRARQRAGSSSSSEPAPLTTSASASAIHSQRYARRSREMAHGKTGSGASSSSIKTSTSVDDKSLSSVATGAASDTATGSHGNISPSASSKQGYSGSPKQRRRDSAKPEVGGTTPSRRPSGNMQWQQDTWKRWEIISSEHTEQETVV